ncbi:hypothetical protein [Paraburkholderia haematera]|uniref:hypothetical protein n=1 Tax=Paraburkholderia haematera TaxID=2793077 RepID=UPI001B8B0862|nr:hypothetical protein [Paraburkholderia haematera]
MRRKLPNRAQKKAARKKSPILEKGWAKLPCGSGGSCIVERDTARRGGFVSLAAHLDGRAAAGKTQRSSMRAA